MDKGVCFRMDGDSQLDMDDDIGELPDVISVIFDNVIAWDMVNHGKIRIFDTILDYAAKLEQCVIKTPTEQQQRNDGLIRDDRLYAVAIGKVKKFECDIDKELLDAFIANSYPYHLWNKFSSNLTSNIKLEIMSIKDRQ